VSDINIIFILKVIILIRPLTLQAKAGTERSWELMLGLEEPNTQKRPVDTCAKESRWGTEAVL